MERVSRDGRRHDVDNHGVNTLRPQTRQTRQILPQARAITVSLAMALVLTRHAPAFAKMAMPKSPLLLPANFQLCFEVAHARCFTIDESKPGFLRYVSALQDSEAKITASQTHKFKNEIKAFMKSIEAARTDKTEHCQQGLSFRLLDATSKSAAKDPVTELRCLEKISVKDSARLSALIERLMQASKPQRTKPPKN